MNSEFIVKARKLSNNLDIVRDGDLDMLDQLKYNLIENIEKTITTSPEIGKRQLWSNLGELIKEYDFIDSKIRRILKKLQDNGRDEYDQQYYNIKQIIETYCDGIAGILELLLIYFSDDAIKNLKVYEKFGTPKQKIKLKQINQLIENKKSNVKNNPTSRNLAIKALKAYYEGIEITPKDGKIYQHYIKFTSNADRKGKPNPFTQRRLNNKIKLFESVIELLPEDKKSRAIDELKIIKAYEGEL